MSTVNKQRADRAIDSVPEETASIEESSRVKWLKYIGSRRDKLRGASRRRIIKRKKDFSAWMKNVDGDRWRMKQVSRGGDSTKRGISNIEIPFRILYILYI